MRLLYATSLAAVVAVLGGCAVSPEAFTDVEVVRLADESLARVTADQEPISGAIDVHEAIARALKYNLDHRVEEMTAALRMKELDLSHFSLLPNVVASSGYAARDSYNASSSVNILTGVESLATSTSQEKRIGSADVTFSWNILDFGLSYIRARQSADKVLIAEEMRGKVVARIIEDVRTAYWRAVSADRLIRRLGELEGRIHRAQANARASIADRQTSPITAATYDRELVDIKRTIQELHRDLSVARTQLAALMNLKPGTPFKLAGGASRKSQKLTLSVSEMIETALQHRGELKEVWYQRRINEQELNAALLELLPGISPSAGVNFDSNEFLYNSNWLAWGAKASWNLIKVVQYPTRREVIEAQDRQLDVRGLAVAMAVITQVHVSRIRYLHHAKEMATAVEYLDAQRRLVGLMRAEASTGRIGEQTLIREEMNTLVAEARLDVAHAAMQNAHAAIYSSMGIDPFKGRIDCSLDVKSLATQLRG